MSDAKVWDTAKGRELLALRTLQGSVLGVAWSPDGSKLATAGIPTMPTKIWEAATGRELLTLPGHQSVVSGVAWSPDGRKLATSSFDGVAKVWDLASSRELLTLRGHQGRVFGVAWSPDGGRLATAGDDETVRVYAIDPVLLLRLVRSRITRDLTPDECRRYLNTDHCPPLPRVP
jgi:WD40 repeat protein